jgi:heptaprenyl diphosphate synthase
MQSRAEPSTDTGTLVLKAGLLLLSVGLAGLEYFIPRIPLLPWLKPGLANIVTIVWLVRFGTGEAVLFSALRSWIVGFYFGFSLVTLALSLSGAVCAALLMGIAWRLLGARGWLGLFGLGILGAFAHNAGQLAAVYAMFARNQVLLMQLPIMAAASALSGGFVGLLSRSLLRATERVEPVELSPLLSTQVPTNPRRTWLCAGILVWSVVVMFTRDPALLGASAVLATLLVQGVTRWSWDALFAPVRRFWLLLGMIAALHLFFSYGQRIAWLPIATREGASEAGVQCLRLWTWLQLSQILKWSGFGALSVRVLNRLLPGARQTLDAGLVALEYFPETIDWARTMTAPTLKRLLRSPRQAIGTLGADLYADLLARVLRSRSATRPPAG